MKKWLFNFLLAVEQVSLNRLRSILTALGIVFGVGAVIAMLAIGSGARQSILDQMKLIGTNNIVITGSIRSDDSGQPEEGNAEGGDSEGSSQQSDTERPYSPGLTLADAQKIGELIPGVAAISPEIILNRPVIRKGKIGQARCVGITNAFFDLNQLQIGRGKVFDDLHLQRESSVCIIGKQIRNRYFNKEDPIGKKLKVGNTWLTVIGVLREKDFRKEAMASLGIRDYNNDVYVPVTTALLRFKNRALFAQNRIGRVSDEVEDEKNYHQIDRLTIQMADSKKLQASADIMARMLKRRHYGLVDFQIEVPELLLEQEQKTQETFNLVLAAIAGISLLVGGIGIMNIMLASVLERVKEIGIRRSLGATRNDIIQQFLFEAIFISLIGGILGVLIGVAAARLISSYADIPTVISVWSVVLSFGVASTIGLIFGLFPARKAGNQDPISALRSN